MGNPARGQMLLKDFTPNRLPYKFIPDVIVKCEPKFFQTILQLGY
jgi:hypothetical protein